MSIQETHLEINDYLDLYLFAGSIDDSLWQHEILEKLQNVHHSKNQQSLVPHNLLEEYKHLNEEILTLYHQLRQQPSNEYLQEKILELKQQRVSLGRHIHLAKNQSS